MKRSLFLLSLIILALFLPAFAQDSYRIAVGGQQRIDKFGVCKIVVNNCTRDIFVPVKTENEWLQFRIYRPACVSLNECINPPSVTTLSPSNIGTTSATLNGSIDSTGGENPTRYFRWGYSSTSMPNVVNVGIGGVGTYSYTLYGLSSDTYYCYQAYATNSAGTGTGGTQCFWTQAEPPPSEPPPSEPPPSPPPGCALLFSFNGKKYFPEMAVNDTQPHQLLEGKSFGFLEKIQPQNGYYKIALWEIFPENQYIDNIYLLKILSNENAFPIPSQDGKIYLFSQKKYPNEVKNAFGQDFTSALSCEDKFWVTDLSKINLINPPESDFISVKFDKVNKGKVKIAIKAKETGIVSFAWRELVTLIEGPEKKGYSILNQNVSLAKSLVKISNLPVLNKVLEKMLQENQDIFAKLWNFAENFGNLEVYQKVNGDFSKVATLKFGNPYVWHTFAFEIDNQSDSLELLIKSTPFLFQISEIYLDDTPSPKYEKIALKPSFVQNHNFTLSSEEILKRISKSDDQYLKFEPGNFLHLFFEDKGKTPGKIIAMVEGYTETYSFGNEEAKDALVFKQDLDLAKSLIENPKTAFQFFVKKAKDWKIPEALLSRENVP